MGTLGIRAHIRATQYTWSAYYDVGNLVEIGTKKKSRSMYIYVMEHYKNSCKGYIWSAHYDVGNLVEIGT